MEAKTKIIFVDENGDKFFGEGPYQLLLGVERTGSLRCAAMEMGMAYSKAMKLVRHAEAALGFPLTQRTVGGSSLTPQGKEWMSRYGDYRDACAQANARLYLEFFPG